MSFQFHYAEKYFYPRKIETERLILKKIPAGDYPIGAVVEFMNTSGVEEAFETYPYEVPNTEEKARDFLEKRRYENRKGENCTYLFELQETKYPFVGELVIKVQEQNVAELGFWISSDYWGNGYCPEAAKAVIGLLLKEKDFENIEVQTTKSNKKAQRAIEKFIIPLGGEKSGERETTLGEEAEYSDSDEEITVVEYKVARENFQG